MKHQAALSFLKKFASDSIIRRFSASDDYMKKQIFVSQFKKRTALSSSSFLHSLRKTGENELHGCFESVNIAFHDILSMNIIAH